MTGPGRIARLADPGARAALGRRIETLTEEVFQVLRWSLMVGLARFLAQAFPDPMFRVIYWGLAALLFAYLVSRFLLRPEIRLFGPDASHAQRLIQTAFNILICLLAFVAVLWAVNTLSDAASALQSSGGPAPAQETGAQAGR